METHPRAFRAVLCMVGVALIPAYVIHSYLKWQEVKLEHEPSIRANIHFPYPTDLPNTNEFAFMFDMQLMNDGAPSWVWKWKCLAKLPSGREIPSDAIYGPDVAQSDLVTPYRKFTKDNYLPEIAFNKAVGQNGVSGWVMFPFSKSDEAALYGPTVKFEIAFEDKKGNTTKSRYVRPPKTP